MIRVEGDFDTRESNYFVGNFEIGNADYYDASITPLHPGETKDCWYIHLKMQQGKSIELKLNLQSMQWKLSQL